VKWTPTSWIVVGAALLFFPALCFANGMVPFPFNLNIPDFVVFFSLFSLVLLVEALVLKCFVRDHPYLRHLHFVFYPNVISSAVGSVLFKIWSIVFPSLALSPDLNNILLFGGLYVITVCVEFPVVNYLYSKRISTARALLISFVMNLASYSLLLIILKVHNYLPGLIG
jgi:hypothetical protein